MTNRKKLLNNILLNRTKEVALLDSLFFFIRLKKLVVYSRLKTARVIQSIYICNMNRLKYYSRYLFILLFVYPTKQRTEIEKLKQKYL